MKKKQDLSETNLSVVELPPNDHPLSFQLSSFPTVLLVDDDLNHRNAMAFDFKRKGFCVLHANSGREAWELILIERINLVITDIRMADGDGVELLRRIKDRDPRLPPVILITGYTDLNLADAKDWGAEAVFPKPIDRKGLLMTSRSIVVSQGFAVKE